jgi:hypothetical protein
MMVVGLLMIGVGVGIFAAVLAIVLGILLGDSEHD